MTKFAQDVAQNASGSIPFIGTDYSVQPTDAAIRHTALIIADSPQDRTNLRSIADIAGYRILADVEIAEALARLDQTVAVDMVILAAPEACEALWDVMVRLGTLAHHDNTSVIMAVCDATREAGFACATEPSIQILHTPDMLEVAIALVSARHTSRHATALHDPGRDTEAERLQRLTEEVSRIARTLAHLSSSAQKNPDAAGDLIMNDYGHAGQVAPYADRQTAPDPSTGPNDGTDVRPVTADEVRLALRMRRLRDSYFGADLFADPAWDMLLDLMAARLSGQRVSVSSLCIAAAVPATTALRWIRNLTDQGVLVRQADPDDARRIFIALSEDSAAAMNAYIIAARQMWTTLS